MMKLKDGYSLFWHDPIGSSCGSGGRTRVDLLYKGDLVKRFETCICGRGCANRDCVIDNWGAHDTVIEEYRVEEDEDDG